MPWKIRDMDKEQTQTTLYPLLIVPSLMVMVGDFGRWISHT